MKRIQKRAQSATQVSWPSTPRQLAELERRAKIKTEARHIACLFAALPVHVQSALFHQLMLQCPQRERDMAQAIVQARLPVCSAA